jgi:phage gp37-like protein
MDGRERPDGSTHPTRWNRAVMAALVRLVPAIHVFTCGTEDVDARHKAGHDDELAVRQLDRRTLQPPWKERLIAQI